MKRKTIPKYKIETVKELSKLVKNKRTILVASIKNIPGSQFQEISKKLRGKAIVKVPKKNLIYMAIDSSKNKDVEKIKNKINENFAILFSDLDSFELAGELLRNTSPAKAKAGQEAPEDIKVEEGPTDLVPGPAISELGALGIQIQIEKGKISIKQSKILAKKGEKISKGAAELMGKLDIKPFKIGFIPVCAFDTKENKFYTEIKIDREGTIAQLKEASAKALGFAVGINYTTEDTVRFLLAKATAQANKINTILTGEPEPVAEVVEEKKEEVKEVKEEKAPAAAGLGALFG
jgi:large subunit ribosomal protein L10